MGSKPSPSKRTFDAFLSHSSKDTKFAARLAASLDEDKLTAWLDHSDLRFGALLRNELQSTIAASRVLVLLWSEAASQSRWVMAEMFTAFHLGRFIIPVVLDATPLPQFLASSAYLDRTRDKTRIGEMLNRSIRSAPKGANQPAPFIAGMPPEVQAIANTVAAAQYGVLAAVLNDRKQAAKANAHVSRAMASLKKLAPMHAMVLNLAGYQSKNTYLIKHWDMIQAGRAPKDPLLERSERYFFETLCVSPSDPSAVNGLGSVLFFERELDAAEFFQRRAVHLMKQSGGTYEAAEQDLEMTLRFKKQQS